MCISPQERPLSCHGLAIVVGGVVVDEDDNDDDILLG